MKPEVGYWGGERVHIPCQDVSFSRTKGMRRRCETVNYIVGHEAVQKMRVAPRSRLAGADFKPPKAALVKSHGGERLGKVTAETVAGMAQRDERKRTIDEASKLTRTRSKLGSDVRSRMSLG